MIVAIDGPAGAGKSTTAKIVANKLGFIYIDTGAMYRAITYFAIKNNLIENSDQLVRIIKEINIDLSFSDSLTKVFINGEDVTEFLRTKEVNDFVSDISKILEIRNELVEKQRRVAQNNNVVMEGRDIGTVVFPNADLKFFLVASIEERTKRRAKEFLDKGENISIKQIEENLKQRDEIDSTRDLSPLTKAKDAIEIDTTKLTIDEQVNLIFKEIEKVALSKGIKININ